MTGRVLTRGLYADARRDDVGIVSDSRWKAAREGIRPLLVEFISHLRSEPDAIWAEHVVSKEQDIAYWEGFLRYLGGSVQAEIPRAPEPCGGPGLWWIEKNLRPDQHIMEDLRYLEWSYSNTKPKTAVNRRKKAKEGAPIASTANGRVQRRSLLRQRSVPR